LRAVPQVNIVSPEFKADPFPLLARLRASEPVYRTALPDKVKTPVWLVTRYGDVNALLKDERFPKNRRSALTPEQIRKLPWVPPMFRPLERNMLDLDAPDHTRLRGLVHKAFTPRLVERMRERVQTLADELLDGVARRGAMDLIDDYALPLPMTIITEILGVPTEDRHKFHKWSKAVVSLSSPNATLRVIPSVWMFLRYLRRFFEVRRHDPRDDLASSLIQAEEAGDRLSGDELLAMVFLLLVAGHETTVNLIGSGVLALLEHPEQAERLRQDPALIKPAVEELLRYTAGLHVHRTLRPRGRDPPPGPCGDAHGESLRGAFLVRHLPLRAARPHVHQICPLNSIVAERRQPVGPHNARHLTHAKPEAEGLLIPLEEKFMSNDAADGDLKKSRVID
jgi:cytochrome P450